MQSPYRLLSVVITLSLSSFAGLPHQVLAAKPPVVLAEHYDPGIDLSLYWVSEKYDGARAWWDGTKFISRGGGVYFAPDWFTKNLPRQVLDGELWIGRNMFQPLMQTIRDQQPDDDAWRKVKFMVFDAPQASGSFSDRQLHIKRLFDSVSVEWLVHVPQTRVLSKSELKNQLELITKQGAEGLMLRRDDTSYVGGRHYGLLKFKLHKDAEARVLAHVPGKGKYLNMLGSLLVEDEAGVQFRIGTGFTDKERQHAPAVGSIVTYRYQGKTQSGKPRFARYLRIRTE